MIIREVKEDTTVIRGDTQVIRTDTDALRNDTAHIINEIGELKDVVLQHGTSAPHAIMLERYLDSMTSYAESVVDTEVDDLEFEVPQHNALAVKEVTSSHKTRKSGRFWETGQSSREMGSQLPPAASSTPQSRQGEGRRDEHMSPKTMSPEAEPSQTAGSFRRKARYASYELMSQIPDGWVIRWDQSSHRYYFVHQATRTSQWVLPTSHMPLEAPGEVPKRLEPREQKPRQREHNAETEPLVKVSSLGGGIEAQHLAERERERWQQSQSTKLASKGYEFLRSNRVVPFR